jgi:hypothetical protein
MSESAKELFKRGLISAKAGAKLGLGTKVQPSKMAGFDDKGAVDQGGGKDKGVPEAGTKQIDKKQAKGSPIASGPSKGGSAGTESQPGKRNLIDNASQQGPKFPAGAKVRKTKMGTPKKAKGPIAKQGGLYGGGGRDTQ